jgi:hypothetical protein
MFHAADFKMIALNILFPDRYIYQFVPQENLTMIVVFQLYDDFPHVYSGLRKLGIVLHALPSKGRVD